MEIGAIGKHIRQSAGKYKYAIIVLLIGLILLQIPDMQSNPQSDPGETMIVSEEGTLTENALVQILESVEGAGKVKVLLSIEAGEETIYQTDIDASSTDNGNDQTVKTVIVTDSQRNELGLIRQVKPAAYKGAVIVCEGAESPAVRLAVTQAVSKITGLGTDAICVLKMQ